MNRAQSRSWAGLIMMLGALAHVSMAGAVSDEPAVNGRLLAMRQEYNDVTAAIDTLMHVYGAERIARLTDPGRALLALPPDHRLVLLIWADDEARIYLNGAPVGETRLTPTRIEIPQIYIEDSNELSIHAWDTDRVEAAVMLGFYVEDPAGALHPIVTTLEDHGWVTDSGEQALEIFYTHTIPDLPGAQVMWGPQLFGEVWLSTRFEAAQVIAAVVANAVAMPQGVMEEHTMDFHRNVGRLTGLHERRQRLMDRLDRMATRPDPHLRTRVSRRVSPLSYTLGAASAFLDMSSLEMALEPLEPWRQRLPAEQRELLLLEARVLKGPEAATPVAPMELVKAASEPAQRTTQYIPPAEQGAVPPSTHGADSRLVRLAGPSSSFLWRMALISLALAVWAGLACWRWWSMYDSVTWSLPGRSAQ
ncbi:MAG: hypothetical protein HN712_02610 [Gemmatimonadetes bacterium]|jgi:hypothetical protein|nr:hypothetical protein [Gemmatimonadota bacterium]MBT6147108.1 hypothetical protein [Gemmatimonadota bacterium]MBT7859168.1 hypothetical protein [Gemmatimonadota bacterium]